MDINWIPILGGKIGFKKAEKEIPAVARELGLKYQPGKDVDELGFITGTYKKHSVSINIDKQTIRVEFPGNHSQFNKLLLKSNRRDRERDKSLYFKSGNRLFDKCFKTKKASEKIQKRIIGNTRFFEAFAKLYKMRWRFIEFHYHAVNMQYKNPGFALNYTLGNNPLNAQSVAGFCYIPANYIKEVVPAVVECMECLMEERS